MVRAIGVLEPLSLADLTAPGVMASQFGLNLSQLASRRYVHTQRIAALVHALAEPDGAPRFDGVLYPSRNNHPAPCAALFDREHAKLSRVDDIALRDHVDWPSFLKTVGADSILSHRAGPILSQGWKPTVRGSAVDKCRC